jgi:hypothetical protein
MLKYISLRSELLVSGYLTNINFAGSNYETAAREAHDWLRYHLRGKATVLELEYDGGSQKMSLLCRAQDTLSSGEILEIPAH